MQVHIRGYCERAATPPEPGTPIRFTASTEKVGRDGLVIAADGWQLDNFRANPGFLWHHDYLGNRAPIGKVTSVNVEGKKLVADVVFDQGDPFAVDVERKYREGFMNAVSVGWDTEEMAPPQGATGAARVLKAELLDISAVNVPGDPNALIQRQIRALNEITQATESEPTPSARASWDEVAARCVRLFTSAAQRPEAERSAEYARIARDYRHYGKTPPELLDFDVLSALDGDTLRGLFLEGEPDLCPNTFMVMADQRAGAVLSKRNQDDLARAIEILQGIQERAAKETETPESEPTETTLERLHKAIVGEKAA